MKIVVLSSRQNFVWHSMQEIIPHIESAWLGLNELETKVSLINVDDLDLKLALPEILSSKYVVLTCFNIKIAKVCGLIRTQLKLRIQFITYVHNMSTICFWPFRAFISADFFLGHDIFITTCSQDEKTLKKSFENALVKVIPFALENQSLPTLKMNDKGSRYLVYIGRLSSQKNLHNLVLGFQKFLAKSNLDVKLILFGKEDNLGSPNMGIVQTDYLERLYGYFAADFLNKSVEFRGHTKRDEIAAFLKNNPCTLISPSLHSDENFGMAVLQAISLGVPCLISSWGGHVDFRFRFPELVQTIKVTQTYWGPSLNANTILKALMAADFDFKPPVPKICELKSTYVTLLSELVGVSFAPDKLQSSKISDVVLARYFQNRDGSNQADTTKIFSGYQDETFHEIADTYIGASADFETSMKENQSFNFAPWARMKNRRLLIQDPHKGEFEVDFIDNHSGLEVKIDNTTYFVNEIVFNQLFAAGYIT